MKQVCVITGGGSGMGLAAAKILGKENYIVIVGRTKQKLEDALKEFSSNRMIFLSGISIMKFRKSMEEKFKGRVYLDKNHYKKYSKLLVGLYLYNGEEIPVLNITGEVKGAYITSLDFIEKFIHFDPIEGQN